MTSLRGVLGGSEVLWENLDTESQRRKEEREEGGGEGRREEGGGAGGGRLVSLTTLFNTESCPLWNS